LVGLQLDATNRGMGLAPGLLARIAALGLQLCLDIYRDEEIGEAPTNGGPGPAEEN
jgi:hypothetical protein